MQVPAREPGGGTGGFRGGIAAGEGVEELTGREVDVLVAGPVFQ